MPRRPARLLWPQERVRTAPSIPASRQSPRRRSTRGSRRTSSATRCRPISSVPAPRTGRARITTSGAGNWSGVSSPQRKRKRALDAAYKVATKQRYVQARGHCERCSKGLGDSWETHHVRRRSNSGVADHAVSNLRTLCPDCHSHIHREVKESKEQGWIVAVWSQLEPKSGS